MFLGCLFFSQSKTKDPLLVGTEMYFEASYESIFRLATKDMGLSYIGKIENDGSYIVEFDNYKTDKDWINFRVVYLDKSLSKHYVISYGSFSSYFFDEYKTALINSGYDPISDSGVEKYITENFVYELRTPIIKDRVVYSVMIGRNPNNSNSSIKRYDESETIFNYNELITYLKKDGKTVTGIVFTKYKDGKLKFERSFKDGKLDGKWKAWYSGGEKMTERNFVNGKEVGRQFEWFLNGQIWREENYVNGIKNGYHKTWYIDGNLKREFLYEDNTLLSKKCWDENGVSISCE